MKYDTIALRTAARAALDRSQKSHEEGIAKAEAADAVAVQEWRARHADAWLAACRSITRKLRKGGAITSADLPRVSDGYRCNDVALHSPPRERNSWLAPNDIVNAIARLDALDFPVVSARQLAELGIETGTLRRIVPFLAPGSVIS